MAADDEALGLAEEKEKTPLEPRCSQNGADKIKILVVEDNHTTQLLYEKGLFHQIFDKKMVASGKEALLVYNEWHPDIILLDIYLPEMTGYLVLKEIRKTIGDMNTTIVMATSLSGTEDVLSCMKLCVEGYIVKPFLPREIGVKILGYYAKKEPERARKAEALCTALVKESQARWLLDKDKSKTKEEDAGTCDGASDSKSGKAAG
jgi:DNA-binding response OmpR family regulator